MKKVLIMAGGTGGHVIPALTIAKKLMARGLHVIWLGGKRGLESTLVSENNIPIYFIPTVPVRGKSIKSLLLMPFRLLRALMQAFIVFKKVQPDVVLGMGGFASFPGGLIAGLLRKPFIIHEQNSIAGLANRCLSVIASVRLQAFPDALSHAQTIGNPVRDEMLQLPLPAQRFVHREGPLRVFVIGGSQGAMAINDVVTKTLASLSGSACPEVWHITGKGKTDEVEKAYQAAGVTAKVQGFIDNPAQAYGWADLVIARAGALTVSELAAVGVASILIPFPYSMDNHQFSNAALLSEVGAAIVIAQHEFTPEVLTKWLQQFSADRQKLVEMANKAASVAMRNASQLIVDALVRLAIS